MQGTSSTSITCIVHPFSSSQGTISTSALSSSAPLPTTLQKPGQTSQTVSQTLTKDEEYRVSQKIQFLIKLLESSRLELVPNNKISLHYVLTSSAVAKRINEKRAQFAQELSTEHGEALRRIQSALRSTVDSRPYNAQIVIEQVLLDGLVDGYQYDRHQHVKNNLREIDRLLDQPPVGENSSRSGSSSTVAQSSISPTSTGTTHIALETGLAEQQRLQGKVDWVWSFIEKGISLLVGDDLDTPIERRLTLTQRQMVSTLRTAIGASLDHEGPVARQMINNGLRDKANTISLIQHQLAVQLMLQGWVDGFRHDHQSDVNHLMMDVMDPVTGTSMTMTISTTS